MPFMVVIDREQFFEIAEEHGLKAELRDALWGSMMQLPKGRSLLDFAHVAFYFGAFLVVAAMTWFLSSSFEVLGGAGLFGLALFYAAGFGFAGRYFLHRNQRTLGGLLVMLAVCMTPLAADGVALWAGYAELPLWIGAFATMVIAFLAICLVPFPILAITLYAALWVMFFDVMPNSFLRSFLGMILGLCLLWLAFVQDRRIIHHDYSFWGYLAGLFGFSLNFFFLAGENEWGLAAFAFAHFLIMALSVPLKRILFLVWGAAGLFLYICYLAYSIFQNSLLFPFILVAVGITLFFFGLYYQRHRSQIDHWLTQALPEPIFRFLQKK